VFNIKYFFLFLHKFYLPILLLIPGIIRRNFVINLPRSSCKFPDIFSNNQKYDSSSVNGMTIQEESKQQRFECASLLYYRYISCLVLMSFHILKRDFDSVNIPPEYHLC
jgi:hypothetical protein